MGVERERGSAGDGQAGKSARMSRSDGREFPRHGSIETDGFQGAKRREIPLGATRILLTNVRPTGKFSIPQTYKILGFNMRELEKREIFRYNKNAAMSIEKESFENLSDSKEAYFLEEGVVTDSILYLGLGEGEKKNSVSQKLKEKFQSEIGQKNLDTFCFETLDNYLESLNPDTIIPEEEINPNFTRERKTVLENKYVRIQMNDPENLSEKNHEIKDFVKIVEEEASGFITSQGRFKALIVVEKNALSIRMDPGIHKEFLGIVLASQEQGTPYALVYRHTPSGFERLHYKDNSRPVYISTIVGKKAKGEGGQVTASVFAKESKIFQETFREYLRLCQSVKNLDLILTARDVPFAVNMFKAGVTNMGGFLDCCNACDRFTSREKFEEFEEKDTLLNDSEKRLLEKYFEKHMEEMEEKDYLKRKIKNLRTAKDLNFEIVGDLINLGQQASAILGTTFESPRQAESLVKMYDTISEKLKKMEKTIRASFGDPHTNVEELTKRLRKSIEPIAMIARFGYGAPDVLKNSDGSVNVGKEGKKFLPDNVRSAYEEFAKITDDKGKDMHTWDDVESLEEAVRFLHKIVVETPVIYREIYMEDLARSEFFRASGDKSYPFKIIDLTKKGFERSEIGKVVIQENINNLGYRLNEVFRKDRAFRRFPVAIFSDDYFELTIPTTKHYVEMNSQRYAPQDKNKEYTISLRYVESGYFGAIQRQDFAAAVLEQCNFKVTRTRDKGGDLCAHFKTENDNEWKIALSKAIQLVASLKDLDLTRIDPSFVGLFKEGVVSMFHGFKKIKTALQTGNIDDETKRVTASILTFGAESEKDLLIQLLTKDAKTFEKDIAPYLEQTNKKALDQFVTHLIHLEKNTRKRGDKKLAGHLHKLGDKIMDLILSEEKPPSS